MKKWMCEIFGHKWKDESAGAICRPFGAVVVNYKNCRRCGNFESHISTTFDIEGPVA